MPIIKFTVEYEQDENGSWIAELAELPGVTVDGQTPDEAIIKALALAPRVLAKKPEHTT